MSDREGAGFDQIEMRALQAALVVGRVTFASVESLGRAGVYAHMLWRRRLGALAALPTAA